MAVNVETLEKLERRITLTLPSAQISSEVESRLRKLSRTVKAAGFRPGKVPMSVEAQRYGYGVQYEGVNDRIGQDSAKPTGDDKTSVAFTTAHRPGALVEVLAAFQRNGVNLSHIEKRPSRQENWQYTFFIDCDAHHTAPQMEQAMRDAKEHCVWIRALGSYPRAERPLND